MSTSAGNPAVTTAGTSSAAVKNLDRHTWAQAGGTNNDYDIWLHPFIKSEILQKQAFAHQRAAYEQFIYGADQVEGIDENDEAMQHYVQVARDELRAVQ